MTQRIKLTEKIVRDAEPIPGRDYQIFDGELRGFAVCIYRGGGRAFTIDYRYAGRQRRMTLGRWPDWSVAAARERAKLLRREVDAGIDPLAERGALREAPRICDLIARYEAEHLVRLAPTNAADQRSMMTKLIGPEWNNRLVEDITKSDVERLLAKIAEGAGAPVQGQAEQPCA